MAQIEDDAERTGPLQAAGLSTHVATVLQRGQPIAGEAEEWALAELCPRSVGAVYRLSSGRYAFKPTAGPIHKARQGLERALVKRINDLEISITRLPAVSEGGKCDHDAPARSGFDQRAIAILASVGARDLPWPDAQAVIDASYAVSVARLTAEALRPSLPATEHDAEPIPDASSPLAELVQQIAALKETVSAGLSQERMPVFERERAGLERLSVRLQNMMRRFERCLASADQVRRGVDAQSPEFERLAAEISGLKDLQNDLAKSVAKIGEAAPAIPQTAPDVAPQPDLVKERMGLARTTAALGHLIKRLDQQCRRFEGAPLPPSPSDTPILEAVARLEQKLDAQQDKDHEPTPQLPDLVPEKLGLARWTVALGHIVKRLDRQSRALETVQTEQQTLSEAVRCNTTAPDTTSANPKAPDLSEIGARLERVINAQDEMKAKLDALSSQPRPRPADFAAERGGLARLTSAVGTVLRRLDATVDRLEATVATRGDQMSAKLPDAALDPTVDRLWKILENFDGSVADLGGIVEAMRDQDFLDTARSTAVTREVRFALAEALAQIGKDQASPRPRTNAKKSNSAG